MCTCSLRVWVDGALGYLSTLLSSIFSLNICLQLHDFSLHKHFKELTLRKMSFAGYPRPATGVPVAVHITQPQISARSYCNVQVLLDQTNITPCFPLSLCECFLFFLSAKNCWESSSDRTSESTETEASHKCDL